MFFSTRCASRRRRRARPGGVHGTSGDRDSQSLVADAARADSVASQNECDARYMRRALELAARGLYTTDPNPRVGCVIALVVAAWTCWDMSTRPGDDLRNRVVGARVMLRGLRTTSDMENEFTMSLMNANLSACVR